MVSDIDWGNFYDIAVNQWNLAPSEFWQLTPQEWWRIHEVKRPRDPEVDYAGSLTDDSIEQLLAEFK